MAAKLLANRPEKWSDCVLMARVKFEKYFNHKVTLVIYWNFSSINVVHVY